MTLEQAVRNWVEQGARDLEAAASDTANGFHSHCAVNCQQAAEKLLKALWIYRNQEGPPRHHRLVQVAETLGAPSPVVDAAASLVPDYIAARYPDASLVTPFERYALEDAEGRLAYARLIREWVLARLAEEGWA
jgi:HEPN domain-containing protein